MNREMAECTVYTNLKPAACFKAVQMALKLAGPQHVYIYMYIYMCINMHTSSKLRYS